jgi:sulfur-oxidizing protein SoxX
MRPVIAAAMLLASHLTAPAAEPDVAGRAETLLRQSFPADLPADWRARLDQDSTQALCSRWRNAPPADVAAQISAQAQSGVRYPADGRLLGDWSRGEQLAQVSTGGQLSRIDPEPAQTRRGGNCFACHVLTPNEVAAGNLGPSLTGYGKVRGTAPEAVRYTYDKIYNAQAFAACSFMPRFGHNGWLTPEQVADLVAFLLDPRSPVNR